MSELSGIPAVQLMGSLAVQEHVPEAQQDRQQAEHLPLQEMVRAPALN